jgi:transposase
LAPWYFTGYCNTEVILTWTEHVLIPELKEGQTVIWDNASFHKALEIKALIEAAGCKLLFLPPYSPDFNPIEHYWAKIKAWIIRFRKEKTTISEALCAFFSMDQKLLE